MPEQFVIRKFLIEHRAEVKGMLLTEYDEVKTMELFREEGREEGEERLGRLIEELFVRGRAEDARKAATDEKMRILLYKEFHIE